MSTRSRIGVEQEDGSVKSIYCHGDGYVDGVGLALQDNFNTIELAEELIALGDLSCVGDSIEDTVAYCRDRGEDMIPNEVKADVSQYFDGDIEEYGYLFTQEGEWLVKEGTSMPVTINSYLCLD